MNDLIDILDLSPHQIEELIHLARDIANKPEKYAGACRGKTLATLFYEPSTRTRLSFEAAMYALGGNVLGFSDASVSSASKGESLSDTVKIVSGYCDVITMRHPLEGAPLAAALSAYVPIINAGDGGHFHPTQTLADLYTIEDEIGRLDNLTIAICGDLKYGRTVHSLIAALSRYPNNKFILISPPELKVPNYIIDDYLEEKADYIQISRLTDAILESDVLYMTRIQRERFTDGAEYERLKDSYILTSDKLIGAKTEMRILHPLPRVNEISTEVDNDKRAAYFRQTVNGKFIRAALLLKLLGEEEFGKGEIDYPEAKGKRCGNQKCISATERNLKMLTTHNSEGKETCAYCGNAL